ncbi:chromosome segregation protein SMC, partial [Micromonospora arborensis]
ALAEADARVEGRAELAAAVTAAVTELAAAGATAGEAAAALTALDDELTVWTGVRAPGGVAEVARAVTAARAEAEAAATAVSLAEEREEKLRGELAGAGDESAVRLLLRAYDDRDRLSGEADTVRAAVGAANDEHATAEGARA